MCILHGRLIIAPATILSISVKGGGAMSKKPLKHSEQKAIAETSKVDRFLEEHPKEKYVSALTVLEHMEKETKKSV